MMLNTAIHIFVPLVGESLFNGYIGKDPLTSGLSAVFLILLLPVILSLFFLIKFVYSHTIREWLKTSIIEDYKKEAREHENAGKFVSAAYIYDIKLKNHEKAAELYEAGGDYRKAALLYDNLGTNAKAREMYEKDGNFAGAAEVCKREGNYEEAANLFEKAGKKRDAALALEKAGNKLAAVRAYREAGEYKRAAMLLEREGMLKEAAEIFGLALIGKKLEESSMREYYEYALKLEKIGMKQKALEIFNEINRINPAFEDVGERLQSPVRPHEEKSDLRKHGHPLRSLIEKGRIEPKYCLRLWVHILKGLQEAYNKGRQYGLLSPDAIVIGDQDNISFVDITPSSAYVPPEIIRDLDLDVRADIYSMGVILYEMLTGSPEGIGSVRIVGSIEDVPQWLDEVVKKCIEEIREDRYQSIGDIFIDIKTLSKGKKD